ncbi:hypothetical protein [Flavobacterium sp.]|uniref:hypothetical protein n=1 Tax=Flavobacterium sp. TaxID=239 RepID=UPI003BC2ACBA
MENSNKKYQKPDSISKVEEPATDYNLESKTLEDSELHPVLVKLIEIGKVQSEQGLGKPHAQVMKEMKKRYNLS